MTSSISLTPEATAVWKQYYSCDPASAHIKLHLGNTAYERCTSDSSAYLIENLHSLLEKTRVDLHPNQSIIPQLNSFQSEWKAGLDQSTKTIKSTVLSSQELLVQSIMQQGQTSAARKKATSKGIVAEADLVECINSIPGMSAHKINEKDANGRFNGDILVSDSHGHRLVIELKNKTNIVPADLANFISGSNESTEKVFVFLCKDGIGSSKKLLEKPNMEITSNGKILIWYRFDQLKFLEQLPFFIALGAFAKTIGSESDYGQDELLKSTAALASVAEVLRREKTNLQKDKQILSAQLKVLQGRETSLDLAIREIEGRDQSLAVVVSRKRPLKAVFSASP